jgi:DnaJ-class molecular chaperone
MGLKKQLEVEHICQACSGNGAVQSADGGSLEKCPYCEGSGKIRCDNHCHDCAAKCATA